MKTLTDRIPGRTKADALERFRVFLQKALSQVTDQALSFSSRPRRLEGLMSIRTKEPIKIRTNKGDLYFLLEQSFSIIPHPRFAGDWKVHTEGYIYKVCGLRDLTRPLIEWHWHPDKEQRGRAERHIHFHGTSQTGSDFSSLHVPSERVSLESLLNFLIRDLGVEAKPGWEGELQETEQRFKKYRTKDA